MKEYYCDCIKYEREIQIRVNHSDIHVLRTIMYKWLLIFVKWKYIYQNIRFSNKNNNFFLIINHTQQFQNLTNIWIYHIRNTLMTVVYKHIIDM